ncbi:MAG TPA: HRDC domain-containing protein [Anaerolineae bacterium]
MAESTSRNLPVLITQPSELEKLVAQLRAESLVAVDTEANSLYAYQERVCLIQFSTQHGDFVVDTVELRQLELLHEIFSDPHVEKVFHACEYDIICLKRDFGFTFANVFDTMVGARVLGWKRVGLGDLLAEKFGVKLDKKFQRANWGARPLDEELLAYARDDTHYLLALRDLEAEQLNHAGRLVEARESFERFTLVEPPSRLFDPDRYISIDGARQLDPAGQGILRELFRWRETRAQAENKPPFKVLGNHVLLHLAQQRPTAPEQLKSIHGLGEWGVRKYGKVILQMIERGKANPQHKPPWLRRHPDALDPAARDRLGKLREWRKQRALARNVEADVIVTNDVMQTIARRNPKTVEGLREAGLGDWKLREYGHEILDVLSRK